MLIYILDPVRFDRIAVIEEYTSCIWTERFIDLGDFTWVMPEAGVHAKSLKPGVVLDNAESSTYMIIESSELKDEERTVTGKSIESFLNQRSIGPHTFTGSPRGILHQIITLMQTQFSGAYAIPGIRAGTSFGGGDDVTEKITKREKVYDLLSRLAKKYQIGFRLDRDYKYPYDESSTYEFAFITWDASDYSEGNADGNPTIRFSPDDDNLVSPHEIYTAVNDAEAVVVNVPIKMVGTGKIGDGVSPVIWGPDGEVDSISDLDLPAFSTRILEPDSDKLTEKYLSEQIGRYPLLVSSPVWSLLPMSEKRAILRAEMARMAEAHFKKSRGNSKRAIDGEVAANSFEFDNDYGLGDMVEVTTGLDNDNHMRKAQVLEYIRSADETGIRGWPTLSQPSTAAPYSDDPANNDTSAVGGDGDHTFSISGLIPADLNVLSPHRVRVTSGQTKSLVAIAQTGPEHGSCTLYFLHNFSYFDESDLPITLHDGDVITIDPTDNDDDAAYVSGHFTIEVT